MLKSFIVYQNILGVSVENDVKDTENLELEKQKQELEKLTQEKE
ncbi:hypothetical protein oki286_04370 [Helicobacter pylori]